MILPRFTFFRIRFLKRNCLSKLTGLSREFAIKAGVPGRGGDNTQGVG